MYRPEPFRADDPALVRQIIAAYPFASLISVVGGVPLVSHIPFVLDGDVILGHVARASPHHAALDGECVVTFLGPHAYVSPRWYRSPESHVPTWNYVTVHVHGRPEVVEAGPAALRMAAVFDSSWQPGPGVDEIAAGITAFRVPLDRVELKLKLSQNRDPADAERVQVALDGGNEAERGVAAWMLRVRRS